MIRVLYPAVIFILSIGALASAQTIPRQIWGTWVVHRKLPTSTVSCWGESDAKKLVGTRITYSADSFRWKSVEVKDPVATSESISAEQFAADHSAADAHGSQVDFHQIGIRAKQVVQVSIKHPPADITGGTIEIPGDRVWLKNHDTIVLSVCGLYFEAKRERQSKRSIRHN